MHVLGWCCIDGCPIVTRIKVCRGWCPFIPMPSIELPLGYFPLWWLLGSWLWSARVSPSLMEEVTDLAKISFGALGRLVSRLVINFSFVVPWIRAKIVLSMLTHLIFDMPLWNFLMYFLQRSMPCCVTSTRGTCCFLTVDPLCDNKLVLGPRLSIDGSCWWKLAGGRGTNPRQPFVAWWERHPPPNHVFVAMQCHRLGRVASVVFQI